MRLLKSLCFISTMVLWRVTDAFYEQNGEWDSEVVAKNTCFITKMVLWRVNLLKNTCFISKIVLWRVNLLKQHLFYKQNCVSESDMS